ncbi:hypothetical protein ACRQ1B_22965 [Rhizobium panacihumi]|uniref:hypothetical protein n=1 Tax=Rhizobium panacihumi TaxID=2008450 RepID=UPI003D7975FF
MVARRTVFALSVLAGLIAGPATGLAQQNDCGPRVAAIVQEAYPAAKGVADGNFEVDGHTIMPPAENSLDYVSGTMVCRQWPARPEILLVAVPLMAGESETEEGVTEGDLDILVLDSESLGIRYRMKLEEAMLSDAVRITSVAFDTAFYQLAPQNLAFGVRISKANGSRANPFEQTVLRLFSIADGKLRPVLDSLAVDENWGEWDTNCNGEFRNTKRTLSIARPGKAGLADIMVAETIVTSVNEEKAGECNTTETKATARHRLRFKGDAYVVPEELRGL